MRTKVLVGILSLSVIAAFSGLAKADFVTGNIVVYRVGTGTGGLTGASTAVFLDEFTPAGALVQSVAMPTTTVGSNSALTASGTVITEGLLTRSTDGNHLVVTGYGVGPGQADVDGTSTGGGTPVLRVVGLVSLNETIDTTTTTTRFSGETFRSAAYDPGTGAIWMTGSESATQSGVVATTLGGSGAGTQVSTTQTNLRQINVFNGQLYVSSGTTIDLGTVGTGLPTTAGQTITELPGFPSSDAYGFFFADLDAGVAGVDTLYVASEDGDALTKYSLVSGSWTSNGLIGTTADNYRGLTGIVSGGTVSLFATRGGDELVSVVDSSGYNGAFSGTPTLLASAGANTAFRGVALAPVPEPGAVLFGALVCGVIGLAAIGRRILGKPSGQSAS